MTEDRASSFVLGVFLTEIKNRFLCRVQIGDSEVTCYIPSSCRLSNFIDMTDRTVLLKPVTTPNARTQYAVYAVKYGREYILLNLAAVNQTVESQLHRRFFSFLGRRKAVAHEFKIENYKTDLFIHDTNTLVEIKSTLAFGREAYFPTVYSTRAIEQLQEISHLLDKGYRACYILVSLNPRVKEIKINSAVQDFYTVFLSCVEKGMTYCAFSVKLIDLKPEIYTRIAVNL